MSLIKGVNIGTSNITATYPDKSSQSNTEKLTVEAVKLRNIYSPSNTIYTGQPQTPEPKVIAIIGGEETIIEKDKDYTLSYSDNTNAGTATVTATGMGNFTGTAVATWTIQPATISVDFTDQYYTYDGNAYGKGVSVTTVGNQTPVITYGTTYGTYDSYTPIQITNVTDSKTVYYQVTAPNHNTVEGSYTLTMNPKTATLVWGTLSWRYDGQSHSTTCSVSNLVNNDTCEVLLQNNTITAIGSQTVTAVGLSNTNYTLPLSGLEKTLTIEPGMFLKVSGVWTPVKEVYKKTSSGWTKLDYAEYNSTFSQKDGKLVKKSS